MAETTTLKGRAALPIYLTLGRLAAPLVICPLIFADWRGFAAFLFALAALSDWADGWIARRWGATSPWGQALDPVADKVLVVLTLFALAASHSLPPLCLALMFVLLIREIGITALRQNLQLPVQFVSKLKTLLQNFAVGGLILGGAFLPWAQGLLAASVALGLYTAWAYIREATR